MEFFKHKPKQSANLATRKDIRRDYVEEAQRSARSVKQASDKKDIYSNRNEGTGHLQDEMQVYMAQIRSEAVQARRLAEQIDNLSQKEPRQSRKQAVMTDSTTIDSGKTPQKQRRASDKPRAAKVRSSFNPLHPSMELPPEQLIRLLGLESKKIRKHNKRAKPAPAHQLTASPGTDKATPPPKPGNPERPAVTNETPPARSTYRQREYEQAREKGTSKNRLGLWLPALVAGVVCGAAASTYLFWMQPEPGAAATAVPPPNKVNRSPVTAVPRKSAIKPPASAKKSTPTSAAKDDPAWLATIEARGKYLRDEAKQRFEQRLKQAAQAPTVAAAPVATPQPEVISTDTPAGTTTSEPEVISTSVPVIEVETTHEEALVDDTGNSTASVVTGSEEPSLQASETPGIEEIDAGELIAEQVPAAIAEPTVQPSDNNIPSTPALDTLPQEDPTGLF